MLTRWLLLCLGLAALKPGVHCLPSPPSGDPIPAIQGLVSRVLGQEWVDRFSYQVIPDQAGQDVFEVDADQLGEKPVLRGNNGVSLASALNFYLKYVANCSISWGRDGTGDQLDLPFPLPLPANTERVVSPVKYRYYQNVCTVSYSMVWWDFARWQREIDWMAMNGLNLILSFTGQEYVWQAFYTFLGLTDAEIKAFFSGPAFLAWQRMGNIHGWGGPLDDSWIKSRRGLQDFIMSTIREFGMINVLPGFAGHVPAGLKRVFPTANLTRTADWGNFNSTYSEDYLLEPTDPLFIKLGKIYYEMLIDEYGTDHVFNADTYNEMNPSSSDPTFLASTNKAIYSAMAAVDEEAVFLMQGWLFHSEFWTNDRIKAFLSGVPNDKMLILDLNSEQSPIWSKTESYFGKPFIWCLLHNYGGTRAIYGNLTTIATGPVDARLALGSTMVGVGMTPEAIEHNPVVYDLMGEMSWRSEKVTDVKEWVLGYAGRRYRRWDLPTGVQAAWMALLEGAYQYHWSWDIKSKVDRAPELVMALDQRFNASGIAFVWKLIVNATVAGELNSTVGPLRYDIVDFGRQTLVNMFSDLHTMFTLAYMKSLQGMISTPEMQSVLLAMFGVLGDLDQLLASDVNFLLGVWISDAVNSMPSTSNKTAVDNVVFNAHNQITMWGPDQNIEDYASKEWAGLVGDYYTTRWQMFLQSVYKDVEDGIPFQQDAYERERFNYEQYWSFHKKTSYPTEPIGDTVEIAEALSQKYIKDDSYILANYDVMRDVDMPGNDLFGEGGRPWNRLTGQAAWLCDVNPTCVGFNSNGYLKNATEATRSSPGTLFYLKKTSA